MRDSQDSSDHWLLQIGGSHAGCTGHGTLVPMLGWACSALLLDRWLWSHPTFPFEEHV